MAEQQEYSISTRGVIISCLITAAIVVILAFLISLTAPPTAKATPFDSHGFDYFQLQEATSAKDAERSDQIREEARQSASQINKIVEETEAASSASSDSPRTPISTDLFDLSLPSYWYDRVNVVHGDNGDVSVYAKDFSEASLVTLKVSDASTPAAKDTPDTAMVFSKEASGNKRVELWMTNFAWVVFNINLPEAHPEGWQADLLDPSIADELVSLQTLGTVPAEKIIQPAKADGTQFETQVDWENAVNEIIPTIVVK